MKELKTNLKTERGAYAERDCVLCGVLAGLGWVLSPGRVFSKIPSSHHELIGWILSLSPFH